MSDIFREVDEDVRSQEVEAIVRRYGPFLAIAAVLLVGIYGGYNLWQNQRLAVQGRAGEQLIAGIEAFDNGNQQSALETFSALAADGPSGYRLLAGFQVAVTQRELGDLAGALATYDGIAANEEFEDTYRNLARIYGGYTLLGMGNMRYAELATRLEPVADSNSSWRYHARELLGFAALQSGEHELAIEHLSQITDDSSAPTGIVRRADELLNVARGATPEPSGD